MKSFSHLNGKDLCEFPKKQHDNRHMSLVGVKRLYLLISTCYHVLSLVLRHKWASELADGAQLILARLNNLDILWW